MTKIQPLIDKLHKKFTQTPVDTHAPNTSIRLMNAKPEWLAIAVVTVDGEVYKAGDHDQLYPIQSMSKPFTYGMALADHGRDYLLKHIGVEPTGQRYNAIILDETAGRPYNPMVNAGAIAVASILEGKDLITKINRVIDTFSHYAGRSLLVDAATLTAEFQTGDRNRAIAYLMRSFGVLEGDLEDALHLYFQQCALMVNTVDLATMAATLANRGVHPFTAQKAIEPEYVRDILSVMYTCGMYDSSGEWAYKVGLPAKSGVSGGIFAVVPGKMGIATFSPQLNANGHSVRGLEVFHHLSYALNLHIFDCA